jgi:hypothetical protein
MNELPATLGQSPLRPRDAALQRGRQEYRAQHGRWPSRSWQLMPSRTAATAPAAPPPPPNPFDAAYPATGGERGPIGMIWREDERFPTWSLPTGRN